MDRRSAVATRVVACSLVLACSEPTNLSPNLGPVPDGSLRTGTTGYVAASVGGTGEFVQYQFTVIARFENRSAAPVFLARCFPTSPQPMYGIVEADSSSVEVAYDPAWACVGHNNQFQILPGQARVDTFLVRGPNSFDETKQQAIGVTSGVFRLILFVASAPGDGPPATPGSLGISNAFVVRTSKLFPP
jgi:hypothetical protein